MQSAPHLGVVTEEVPRQHQEVVELEEPAAAPAVRCVNHEGGDSLLEGSDDLVSRHPEHSFALGLGGGEVLQDSGLRSLPELRLAPRGGELGVGSEDAEPLVVIDRGQQHVTKRSHDMGQMSEQEVLRRGAAVRQLERVVHRAEDPGDVDPDQLGRVDRLAGGEPVPVVVERPGQLGQLLLAPADVEEPPEGGLPAGVGLPLVDEGTPAVHETDDRLDLICDLDRRGEPGLDREPSQDPLGERVERVDRSTVELLQGAGERLLLEQVRRPRRRIAQGRSEAVPQLGRRCLGEGDGRDLRHRDPGTHQLHHPPHERGGLAGSGSCVDEQRLTERDPDPCAGRLVRDHCRAVHAGPPSSSAATGAAGSDTAPTRSRVVSSTKAAMAGSAADRSQISSRSA